MLIHSLLTQLKFHIILKSLKLKNQLDTHSDSIKNNPEQSEYQHTVYIYFRLYIRSPQLRHINC